MREQIEETRRHAIERRAERKRAADANAAVWARPDVGIAAVSFNRLVPLDQLNNIVTAPGLATRAVYWVADVDGPDNYGHMGLGDRTLEQAIAEETAWLRGQLTKQLEQMELMLASLAPGREQDDMRRSIVPKAQQVGRLTSLGPAAITTIGMFVQGPLPSIGSLRAHPDVEMVEHVEYDAAQAGFQPLPPRPFDLPDGAR